MQQSSQPNLRLLKPLPANIPLITSTGKYICNVCHDAGFVRKNLEYSDPNFGKAIPCTACNVVARRIAARCDRMSIIPKDLAKKNASWETFPSSMDQRSIALMRAYVKQVNGQSDIPLEDKHTGVVLMGKNQVGKTGLAYCAYRAIPGSVFLPVSEIFIQFRMAKLNNEDTAAFRDLMERLVQVPHLVLDDLGAEKMTDSRQEDLFMLLNRRVTESPATTITTNLSRDQIRETFGDRIYSRLMRDELLKITVTGAIGALIKGGKEVKDA